LLVERHAVDTMEGGRGGTDRVWCETEMGGGLASNRRNWYTFSGECQRMWPFTIHSTSEVSRENILSSEYSISSQLCRVASLGKIVSPSSCSSKRMRVL
jgi:hypothetical protein